MRSFRPGKTLIALFTAFAMSATVFSPPDATAQTTSQWVPDQHEELFEQRDELSFSKGGAEYFCQVAHIADGRVYTDAWCSEDQDMYYRDSYGEKHYLYDRQSTFSRDKGFYLNRFASYAIPDSLLPQVGESAEPDSGGYLSPGDTVTLHGIDEDYEATVEGITDGFLAIVVPGAYGITGGAPVSHYGNYLGMYTFAGQQGDKKKGIVLLANPEHAATKDPDTTMLFLQRESQLSYDPGEVDTIDQGDKIFTARGRCTVGYIDKPNNRIFLAGHCSDGGPHYFTDENDKNRHYYLGTMVTEFDFEGDLTDSTMSKDWGYIDIPEHRSALLGENRYTSDSVLLPSMLRVGQMVYGFGQTTDHVMQNYVMGVINNVVHFTQDNPMHKGDSGGPNWVVDEEGNRHFFGVNSGGELVNEGEAVRYGIAIGWHETPTSNEEVRYTNLSLKQWDAYQKAQEEVENPTRVNQDDTVGLDDNDRDLFLDQECTARYVDHVHQRIYTSPACTGPGGARAVSTTSDWPNNWALAEIGTFYDAQLPYIQAPNDIRLGENPRTPGELLSTDQIQLGDKAVVDGWTLIVAGTIGNKFLLLPYHELAPEVNTPVTINDDVAGLVAGIYYDENGSIKGIEVQSLVDANPVELTEGWQENLLYEYAKATDENAPEIEDVEKKEFESDTEINPFKFTITDEYNEVTVKVTDLPKGLSADIEYDDTKLRAFVTIHGSPIELGWKTATVTARDARGNESSTSFGVQVNDATPPVIDTTSLTLEAGEASNREIAVADNDAVTSIQITGLPEGLTATDGHVYGATTAVGNHSLQVSATDPSGNVAKAMIPLQVTDTVAPTVPNTELKHEIGSRFSHVVMTEDKVGVTQLKVSRLPGGLKFDEGSRTISGDPTKLGEFRIPIQALDAVGNSGNGTLLLRVVDTVKPKITVKRNPREATEFNLPIQVKDATETTVSVSELPAGLRFEDDRIVGKAEAPGTYRVVVTATDKAGNRASETVTLTVPKPRLVDQSSSQDSDGASGSSKGGIAALVVLGLIALVGGIVATNPQLMKQIQSMLP